MIITELMEQEQIKQRITYFYWADTGEIGIEMHLSKNAYEVRK